MKLVQFLAVLIAVITVGFDAQVVVASDPSLVKTSSGYMQGTIDQSGGIYEFKGIPYAQPPVGSLRWRAPQPVSSWTGVLQADKFGPRGVQHPFGDMVFRSNGMSEDCLYLNVWTPNTSNRAKLPVLVYFYGGGFISGDGSEYRYDGESLAKRGIVTVTVNYRLGIFGFFAHPELTRESPNHSSGNYGLLDQNAALRWVQRNISQFGGDPHKVTIGGESAGSFSVSAQMASPLSIGLFHAAIGESGSLLGGRLPPLSHGEEIGASFGATIGATTLASLRNIPADQLLAATLKPDAPHFGPVVDGYFFKESPVVTFQNGRQAHVPLLVGWNSLESGADGVLGGDPPTVANYLKHINDLYGDDSAEIFSAFPATTDADVQQASIYLASARFIAFGTWKWFDLQCKTGDSPVYRYFFSRSRPGGAGAVHSGEIEYALGNLSTNKVYAWTPDDYQVSNLMESYFANFIKTCNPNGDGLPTWPAANDGGTVQVMHIDVHSEAQPALNDAQFQTLDQVLTDKATRQN